LRLHVDDFAGRARARVPVVGVQAHRGVGADDVLVTGLRRLPDFEPALQVTVQRAAGVDGVAHPVADVLAERQELVRAEERQAGLHEGLLGGGRVLLMQHVVVALALRGLDHPAPRQLLVAQLEALPQLVLLGVGLLDHDAGQAVVLEVEPRQEDRDVGRLAGLGPVPLVVEQLAVALHAVGRALQHHDRLPLVGDRLQRGGQRLA